MFEWFTSFIQQTGYFGIVLLMLAENVFPPIPSELIMPLSGFIAAQGRLNFFLVVLSGTLGSLLGALFWYWIGRWLGEARMRRWSERHGRWLTLSPSELDDAMRFCKHHSRAGILAGRVIPAVRTLISIPAGILKIQMSTFVVYTFIGSAIWNIVLTLLGYVLQSQYETVGSLLSPLSNAIGVGLLCWYIYRVITFSPSKA
jgi:membrane protein DedA with SNARE-associated domain